MSTFSTVFWVLVHLFLLRCNPKIRINSQSSFSYDNFSSLFFSDYFHVSFFFETIRMLSCSPSIRLVTVEFSPLCLLTGVFYGAIHISCNFFALHSVATFSHCLRSVSSLVSSSVQTQVFDGFQCLISSFFPLPFFEYFLAWYLSIHEFPLNDRKCTCVYWGWSSYVHGLDFSNQEPMNVTKLKSNHKRADASSWFITPSTALCKFSGNAVGSKQKEIVPSVSCPSPRVQRKQKQTERICSN